MVTVHENVVLIECEDDLALEELAAAVDLEAGVVKRLSKRAVIVDPETADALVQRMQRKGYTPRVITGEGA
jgi:hypothetical protein